MMLKTRRGKKRDKTQWISRSKTQFKWQKITFEKYIVLS